MSSSEIVYKLVIDSDNLISDLKSVLNEVGANVAHIDALQKCIAKNIYGLTEQIFFEMGLAAVSNIGFNEISTVPKLDETNEMLTLKAEANKCDAKERKRRTSESSATMKKHSNAPVKSQNKRIDALASKAAVECGKIYGTQTESSTNSGPSDEIDRMESNEGMKSSAMPSHAVAPIEVALVEIVPAMVIENSLMEKITNTETLLERPNADLCLSDEKTNPRNIELAPKSTNEYNQCDFFNPSMEQLKEHMKKHPDVRPFKCQHCNREFKENRNLQRHAKSNACKERPPLKQYSPDIHASESQKRRNSTEMLKNQQSKEKKMKTAANIPTVTLDKEPELEPEPVKKIKAVRMSDLGNAQKDIKAETKPQFQCMKCEKIFISSWKLNRHADSKSCTIACQKKRRNSGQTTLAVQAIEDQNLAVPTREQKTVASSNYPGGSTDNVETNSECSQPSDQIASEIRTNEEKIDCPQCRKECGNRLELIAHLREKNPGTDLTDEQLLDKYKVYF